MTDPRNETDPLPNGWTWEQALDRVLQLSLAEDAPTPTVNAFSRFIAQHEKPPVDEATEIWSRAFEAWSTRTHENAVTIIRDALAKARAGK